jgi:hypothetical protein
MNYIEIRLEELRSRYKETGEAKWRYKYEELKRIADHLLIKVIDEEQQMEKVVYEATSGGRAYKTCVKVEL